MAQPIDACMTFALGALSGTSAWVNVHPFDVIKVQLQVDDGKKKVSPFGVFRRILNDGGVRGLYAGISSGIMRQLTYTSMRLGIYNILRERYSSGPSCPLYEKILIGMLSGALASFSCCPIEVSLVRMQADSKFPPKLRRNYAHVGSALVRLFREEGIKAGWKGATPTVLRGMVVSTTQLSSYDQAKTLWNEKFGLIGVPLHLSAALTSAIIYSYCSLPLDIAKSRMQNQRPLSTTVDGKVILRYTSVPQTIQHIIKHESIFGLWTGMTPYFLRSGGHTVLMFLFLEQYRSLYLRSYKQYAV